MASMLSRARLRTSAVALPTTRSLQIGGLVSPGIQIRSKYTPTSNLSQEEQKIEPIRQRVPNPGQVQASRRFREFEVRLLLLFLPLNSSLELIKEP